jgi:DNA polymerase-3 subunit alpha
MQDHNLAEQKRTNPLLKQLSDETGIPLVCTNDIHYIEKDDANAQDLLLCVGTNSKKNDPDRMRFPNQEFYMKSEEQMASLFSCVLRLWKYQQNRRAMQPRNSLPGPLLPDFDVPRGLKAGGVFAPSSHEGLKKRYTHVTEI